MPHAPPTPAKMGHFQSELQWQLEPSKRFGVSEMKGRAGTMPDPASNFTGANRNFRRRHYMSK